MTNTSNSLDVGISETDVKLFPRWALNDNILYISYYSSLALETVRRITN